MSDGISTATRGAVFEVTIDRPKANAIDLAASRRLNQVFAGRVVGVKRLPSGGISHARDAAGAVVGDLQGLA